MSESWEKNDIFIRLSLNYHLENYKLSNQLVNGRIVHLRNIGMHLVWEQWRNPLLPSTLSYHHHLNHYHHFNHYLNHYHYHHNHHLNRHHFNHQLSSCQS